MTDRPIIFSAPMVRALLDGRKSQTRRVLKPQPALSYIVPCDERLGWFGDEEGECNFRVPYAPGDRLYVREAHSLHCAHGQDFPRGGYDHGERWGPWSGLPIAVSPDKTQVAYYREGFDRSGPPRWRPSIHMPRWASRLTLIVTDVRVQRLCSISEADAEAEGIEARLGYHDEDVFKNYGTGLDFSGGGAARASFKTLWNSLHGPDAWAANPWVVAVSFDVQHGNIAEVTA
jgi:hypothetical protein